MANASPIEEQGAAITASPRGHLVVYLFLLALAGPAGDIVAGRDRPVWLAALALGAFVACFVVVVETAQHWHGGCVRPLSPARRRLHGIFVFALAPIAVATTLTFGSTWLELFVFVTITSALTVPLVWAPRAIVAVSVLVVAVELLRGWSTVGAATAAAWALSTLMAGFIALLLRRRAVLIRELRAAQGQVARLAAAEAVAEERLRFARDLHDLLGHSLSVIALKAELARRLLEAGDAGIQAGGAATQACREVADIEQITRRALGEVREAVTGYRVRSLDAELDWARAALAAAGIEVRVTVAEASLPAEVEDLLAWAVREAATNIVRHSSAGHAEIEVAQVGADVHLEVSDDGRGAGPESIRTHGGSGLVGLEERLATSGGRLTAGPAVGGGFRLTVVVPRAADATPVTPDVRQTLPSWSRRTVAP